MLGNMKFISRFEQDISLVPRISFLAHPCIILYISKCGVKIYFDRNSTIFFLKIEKLNESVMLGRQKSMPN